MMLEQIDHKEAKDAPFIWWQLFISKKSITFVAFLLGYFQTSAMYIITDKLNYNSGGRKDAVFGIILLLKSGYEYRNAMPLKQN